MTIKVCRMVTHLGGFLKCFNHVDLQSHVLNKNIYFSITRMLMATKLGRMITYLEGLLPETSHDLLVT